MKIPGKIIRLISCTAMFLCIAGCEVGDITEFGFDGAISGTVKDQDGRIVSGSIISGNLAVQALGESDQVTTEMRVKGDGTYQNTKLYPKKYKIWITGPVILVTDTITIDFSKERTVVKDLVVIPFVTISLPMVIGSPGSSSVDIGYDMTGNDGMTLSKRELYCSTNPYPDASTGSGPFYETKTIALIADEGEAAVTGLVPKTKYYIRIGAQATGASGFNYSDQIIITTR